MVARKVPGKATRKKSPVAASKTTLSGPAKLSRNAAPSDTDAAMAKMEGTQQIAAAMPFNANKPFEYQREASIAPREGQHVDAPTRSVTGSTLSESNVNDKTGAPQEPGVNPATAPLTRVRVDSVGQALTTNQGVRVGDNQNSLKAGLRGPTLMEDFILREKITHFDHERIP